MSYTIIVAREAHRELERLPKTTARRISQRIDALEQLPRPPGCLKLTGEHDLWRLRVGDYRVVYRVDDDQQLVKILRIRHRRDAYD